MPNITNLDPQEMRLLREIGMETKDYGVMHRRSDMVGFLCHATRDFIWIKTAPEEAEDSSRRKPDDSSRRKPDDLEKQIMQENGIPDRYFDVTARFSDVIQLRFCDTQTYVEIWRGDRKW